MSIVDLRRRAKQYGITQDEIASAAHVGRTLVCHVFAGRAKSSDVVATARRLVAARPAVTPDAGARQRWARRVARRRSTARALLKHATGWAGGDLQ